MKCPVCKTPDLLMTERQNIEIDYCPTCRGVWLDRGELDKLLGQMQEATEPERRDARHERHARGASAAIDLAKMSPTTLRQS
jgi:Zn-finger nucleic acid-binding protein